MSAAEERRRRQGRPGSPAAGLAAPDRDRNGRFAPGNQVARLKVLKRRAHELPWLDPGEVEDWLRPFVEAAREDLATLLRDLPSSSALVNGVAEELVAARVVARALIARGLDGDDEALERSRQWLREARQHADTLKRVTKEAAEDDRDRAPPVDLVEHMRRRAGRGAIADREKYGGTSGAGAERAHNADPENGPPELDDPFSDEEDDSE